MKDQYIGFQVVGYPDERGLGEGVYLTTLKKTKREVMDTWAAIKPGHRFPKGVKFAVLEQRLEADKAIFISETISDEQDAAAELRANRDKDAAQKKIDAAKAKAATTAAEKLVSDKAVARDAASFELASATQDRDNAKSNATETETNPLTPASKKLFQSRLETAEARLKKASESFSAADKAWAEAKDARAKLAAKNLSA